MNWRKELKLEFGQPSLEAKIEILSKIEDWNHWMPEGRGTKRAGGTIGVLLFGLSLILIAGGGAGFFLFKIYFFYISFFQSFSKGFYSRYSILISSVGRGTQNIFLKHIHHPHFKIISHNCFCPQLKSFCCWSWNDAKWNFWSIYWWRCSKITK